MRKYRFLSFVILIFAVLIIFSGCGGSTTGTGTSSTASSVFDGYVYAPIQRSGSPSSAGIVVLQQSTPPAGYQALRWAIIQCEGGTGQAIYTDSTGHFILFSEQITQDEDGSIPIIIYPPENLSNFAPIRLTAYRQQSDTNIDNILLHPNARNIDVGEAIQLYAKTNISGIMKYIDPSMVTWQLSDETLATISSDGVLQALKEGTVYVTVSVGNISCTGVVHIRNNTNSGYTLSGKVTDSQGNAVKNVAVTVLGYDTVGITDSNGRYSIPHIDDNQDIIVLAFKDRTLRYAGITHFSGNTTLDIVLSNGSIIKGSVNGIVTNSSGTPLSGVLVSAGDWDAVTDGIGHYRLNNVPDGTYLFSFSKDGYNSVSTYKEIVSTQTNILNVTMEPRSSSGTGSIQGRVVNQAGEPISGATISFSTRRAFPGKGSTTTNAEGYFTILGLTPGNYTLQAQKECLKTGYADVAVSSGQQTNANIVMLKPTSIQITPPNATIAKGNTLQFYANAVYPDNTTQDITDTAIWESSNPETADFSNIGANKGFITSGNSGSTTVSASWGSVKGTTNLTVTDAQLVSIQITPPNPTTAKGNTVQFTATGIYTDGTHLDITQSVEWSSSNTNISTISNSLGTNGLASALNVGNATITASKNNIHATTTLTVTNAQLVSIEITPTDPSVPRGLTQQFTATGIYTDNTNQDITDSVTWSSSNISVATISNSNETKGLATALETGSTEIKAVLGDKEATTQMTVTSAQLVSIQVTPTNPSIAKGLTQQFTATGIYTDNTNQDITQNVTWSSSDTNTATISNTDISKGVASGLNTGTTTIKAELGDINGSTNLTVTAAQLVSIQITPVNPTIPKGLTQQFTATGVYTDNTNQNITSSVTWTSSNTNTASISNASGSEGLATALNSGSTTIKAQLGSIETETNLTVTNAQLVSIEITPANPTVPKGTDQQFTATGTFTDNSHQNITSSATWTSSDTNIASISNAEGSKGLASALNTGTTTIKAAKGSVEGNTGMMVVSQAGWMFVGSPGFSAGQAGYPSICVYNGIPYVAFMDQAHGNKASVMRYNGTGWEYIGDPGFSAGEAYGVSLFMCNGILYITYGDHKVTVKKYNGTNWENVGTPGFSEGPSYWISLFVYNDTPYVAYLYGDSGIGKVKKYNGTTWENVGDLNYKDSCEQVNRPSLFVYNGTPYLAYLDVSQLTVVKYNGSTWEYVGNPKFTNFSMGFFQSLFVYNGTPYVCYREISYPNDKVIVAKFNGNSWEKVGDIGNTDEQVAYTSLYIYNGTPFVSYIEHGKPTVKKFNGDNWEIVGNPKFSDGDAWAPSLFVYNGIPYVAYSDGYSGRGYKITVMKYNWP